MRTRSARLLMLAFTSPLLTCAAALPGCQGDHQPQESVAERRARYDPWRTMDVKPEWAKYAMGNYRGVVLADLTERGRDTAAFPDDPHIVASQYKSGGPIQLLAVGEVETINLNNVRYRQTYTISWQQSGGSWDLIQHELGEAGRTKAVPTGPNAPTGGPTLTPTSKPTTKPAG